MCEVRHPFRGWALSKRTYPSELTLPCLLPSLAGACVAYGVQTASSPETCGELVLLFII